MSAVLDDATAALLAQMRAGGGKPLEEQTVDEVRAGIEAGTAALGGPLTEVGHVDERTIPVAGGSIAIRIYTPPDAPPGRALPVVVGFHGGGFVAGSLDTYERTARYLCRHAWVIVVAVGYRRPPEHKFPTAVEDADAAVRWVADNAAGFGGDPSRIAVTGDSAGGNLAAVVCLLARDRGAPRLIFQALFYPVTDHTLAPSPSRAQFGNGEFFLSNAALEWFRGHYLARAADAADLRASPLLAPDHSGLPPALIITAGCDPLLDDGRTYAERLSAAGVPVEYRCYEGTIHAFTAFAGALPAGAEALSFASGRIRAALQA